MVCEARSALKASDKCSTLPGTAGPARSSYLSWQSLWPFNGCQSIWPSTWAAKEDRCMLYARHCSVCKTVHLSCVFAQLREQEHLAFYPHVAALQVHRWSQQEDSRGECGEGKASRCRSAECRALPTSNPQARWSWEMEQGRYADLQMQSCDLSLSLSLSVVSTGEDMRLSHCRVRIASST